MKQFHRKHAKCLFRAPEGKHFLETSWTSMPQTRRGFARSARTKKHFSSGLTPLKLDLFRLGGLFRVPITDHVLFSRELFFYPSDNYSFVYTRLHENLKARIRKSIITWSLMVQQTAQSLT